MTLSQKPHKCGLSTNPTSNRSNRRKLHLNDVVSIFLANDVLNVITYPLKLNVNGEWKKAEVTSRETLLYVLRERLGHTEIKEGCGKGDCGACAVLLNGKPVNACLVLALQADGQRVVTLKGIGTPDKPHPLQESFVKKGAIQCGFCSAGMIVTAKGLLDENPKPSREEIKKAISGNLCRCTGYKKIIEAIEEAALKQRRQ